MTGAGELRSAFASTTGGVMTEEAGAITGDLELVTRPTPDGSAVEALVRYAGARELYAVSGSPVRAFRVSGRGGAPGRPRAHTGAPHDAGAGRQGRERAARRSLQYLPSLTVPASRSQGPASLARISTELDRLKSDSSDAPSVNLAGMQRMRWAERVLSGDP